MKQEKGKPNTGPRKKGMQDKTPATDYGSREAWGKVHQPESVSAMAKDKAKYKHRDS